MPAVQMTKFRLAKSSSKLKSRLQRAFPKTAYAHFWYWELKQNLFEYRTFI